MEVKVRGGQKMVPTHSRAPAIHTLKGLSWLSSRSFEQLRLKTWSNGNWWLVKLTSFISCISKNFPSDCRSYHRQIQWDEPHHSSAIQKLKMCFNLPKKKKLQPMDCSKTLSLKRAAIKKVCGLLWRRINLMARQSPMRKSNINRWEMLTPACAPYTFKLPLLIPTTIAALSQQWNSLRSKKSHHWRNSGRSLAL